MSKQHPNVKQLRYIKSCTIGPIAAETLDWAIRVCESADILVNAKGKHADLAYGRLEEAVNSSVFWD